MPFLISFVKVLTIFPERFFNRFPKKGIKLIGSNYANNRGTKINRRLD